jgi:hypothetical protein
MDDPWAEQESGEPQNPAAPEQHTLDMQRF